MGSNLLDEKWALLSALYRKPEEDRTDLELELIVLLLRDPAVSRLIGRALKGSKP